VRLGRALVIKRFRAALVGAGVGLLLVPAVSAAKTYAPNKTADHVPNGCSRKDCTLREAVLAANHHTGKDKVVLRSKKPYKLRIAPTGLDDGTTGDLNVTDPVTIKHTGKGNATIDANGLDRVLFADTPPSMTEEYSKLKHITITGGNSPSSGGGLQLGQSMFGLDHSKVVGNQAASDGGGIAATQGELTLTDSTVSGNQAGAEGGGVWSGAKTLILGSTISGNHITGAGIGGGLLFQGTHLTMTNDTVADNKGANAGGGIDSFGTSTLNDVTITANDGEGVASHGAVSIANSILIGNSVGVYVTDPDCSGGFISGGHNLVYASPGCTGFGAPGDFYSDQPKLGKLADNGGPTKTVALETGSPAIGKAGKASSAKRDQRGRRRDEHPDVGAYEHGAKP
jgi:CSLREA domain-containing protein